jgi:hypothetical protein
VRNNEFIEAVNIIAKHIPTEELNGWGIQAEHDQIWFGNYEWVTDPKDKKRLEELGWFEHEGGWSNFT